MMTARMFFCIAVFLFCASKALAQQSDSQPEAANQQSQPATPNPGEAQSQPASPPAGQPLQLPPVTVITPKERPAPKPLAQAPATPRQPAGPASRAAPPQAPAGQPTEAQAALSAAGVPAEFVAQVDNLNRARENIFPKIGVSTYEVSRQTIEALPQGDNASLDKVLLQTPGVYQDSAASGNLHIRNEHANLQYRINGIQLPEGVAGFGQILETSIIGNMA